MPSLQLTTVLQAALPHVSASGRAFLNVLGCVNGDPPRSQELAHWLGFPNRHRLARALRRDGLPPLDVIGGWSRILYWLIQAEASGRTLRDLARRESLDPALAYRLIRRVTGRRWSQVRGAGLAVALRQFKEQCAEYPRLNRPPPIDGGGGPPPDLIPSRGPTGRYRLVQSISERVAVSGGPFDVAVTPTGSILVTRGHAAAVDVLQINPLRVTDTIPVGSVPTRVIPGPRSAEPGERVAYVTVQFDESLTLIDLEQRRRKASIYLPGHPLGAVLSPDGRTIYVTTNLDRLLAISTSTFAVRASSAVPYGIPQVTVHPSGRWVFVPGWRAGVIAEVDTTSLEITRRFDLGGIVQEVVVSPDGQDLFAANEAGWLDVVHLASGVRTARVEFGTAAFGLALSADYASLFVGLLNAGRVLVLQRDGLRERAAIVTGGRPRLIAADPRGDGVLVANEAGWVDLFR